MPKQVRCPQCKKLTPYEGNPFRPFCSERCKKIDLGDWATGQHVISTPEDVVPGELSDEDLDAHEPPTIH